LYAVELVICVVSALRKVRRVAKTMNHEPTTMN